MYSLHKISVSVLSFAFFLNASGTGSYSYPAGASENGMGYSCVMKPDFWSSFYNQALLPYQKSLRTGVNFENRFGIRELGTATAAVIIPSGKASIGAVFSHSGYSDFRRKTGALACGLKLSEKISAGAQIDYFSENYPGTECHSRIVTAEFGLHLSPSENVMIGLHIFNPVPNSIRREKLPSAVSAGAGVILNRLFFASAEIRLISDHKPELAVGAEYEAAKKFRIRGGFRTENTSFSFGFGYDFGFFRLDMGFSTHEALGITSSASIIFKFR